MPDEMDVSQEREIVMLEYHLSEMRRMPRVTPHVGCLECGAAIENNKACEFYSGCLDDWQRRQDARIRNGDQS